MAALMLGGRGEGGEGEGETGKELFGREDHHATRADATETMMTKAISPSLDKQGGFDKTTMTMKAAPPSLDK